MTFRLAVFALAAALAIPLAHAQQQQYTYRCTSKEGKKYYGQTVPPQCLGQPLELINKQGMVVKRIDPEGDEKARIAKEQEAAKRKDLEAAEKDSLRRNRALLATYQNEKEIDQLRQRELRENQRQVTEIEGRIADIRNRRARFEKELNLFKESGKGKPPARLEHEIINADIDLKAQEALLAAKKKEVESINARYDEDKRRYREAVQAKRR